MMAMKAFTRILKATVSLLSSKTSSKFTVCIEGNIASGKTSFLNFLDGNPLCEVLAEPVSKWRDINGVNPLAKMYEDPQRWSFTLQTYIQLTMLQAHRQQQTKPVKLMERSLLSANYCFVENQFNNKVLSKMEYDILMKWFDWIKVTQDVHVDLIVYLRTCPYLLHDRIVQRGRKEEKPIPVEYLRQLHELHDDWLIRKRFPITCPVLVINANEPLDQMEKTCQQHRRQILCGMETA